MSQSNLRWINDVDQYGNPIYNVTKYYSGINFSYIQTTTITNHLRVSYFPRDHSAVTTENQDSVISKWAYGPLVKHTLAQCPFYSGSQIKYYKLWPEINGTFTALCENSERTFTSNMSIPSSTYTWTKDNNLLDYVSGAGTTSYRVKGKSNSGDSWIQLQMTTPSGEVATNYDWVWVNKPVINSIGGPTEGYTGNRYYYYNVPSYEQRALSETSWLLQSLNGNYVDAYTTGYAYITFYNPGYYYVMEKADNTCGSTGWKMTNVNIYQGYRFSISPNPASEEANIKITKASSDAPDTEFTDFDIRIFDLNGILYHTDKKSGLEFTLPLSNLRDGAYIVNIRYGKKSVNLPLMVKH